MSRLTLADVQAAQAAIGDAVIRTPLTPAPRLSAELGCDLRLKLENLQHTNAFKARGALNKLLTLDADQRRAGVIACSAGNHAQGLAYHARRLAIPATIVMPDATPFTKIRKTEDLGATVVLHGADFDASVSFTHQLTAERGLTLVHPFDDPAIAAGQGTVALEMLEQEPALDSVVVPIGGGGLIAGVAAAVKGLRPDIAVIGAQAARYAAVAALRDGGPAPIGGPTVAEGIAVKAPAAANLAVIAECVDHVATLDEAAIEAAIFDFLNLEKIVAEGAAGAGLAAIRAEPERFAGKTVGLVVCGGNIDARLLSTLILRGLVRDGAVARLRFTIDDRPGMLSAIAGVIGDERANVIEVIHQRMMQSVSVKSAELDVVIEARDRAHVDRIVARFRADGVAVEVMNTA